jgi:7-carboxy-7-deazaguanine synthase
MNSKQLKVVEVFQSIQGEGHHQGMLATFVRLFGCNLNCAWCDTPAGRTSSPDAPKLLECYPDYLFGVIKDVSGNTSNPGTVVITGGEPLLEAHRMPLNELLNRLLVNKWKVCIETNGTQKFCKYDYENNNNLWVTISPKPPLFLVNMQDCDEIKLVGTPEVTPELLEHFQNRWSKTPECYLQPEYANFEASLAHCMTLQKSHPLWKIRLQMHKILEVR